VIKTKHMDYIGWPRSRELARRECVLCGRL